MLGAMSAAIHLAAGFMTMTYDATAAMSAFRSQRVNGALEAVKVMRNPILNDFEWLVVFVPTALAGMGTRVQLGIWIGRQLWS